MILEVVLWIAILKERCGQDQLTINRPEDGLKELILTLYFPPKIILILNNFAASYRQNQ